MAGKVQRTSSKSVMPNTTDFAKAGQQQFERMLEMQNKFFNLDEMTRDWSARVKAESDLANEFMQKLSRVRTIPEAVAVSPEWINRRMEMLAEDSRRLLPDGQKFMAATAQMLSPGSKGGST
jgi:Phasin protein